MSVVADGGHSVLYRGIHVDDSGSQPPVVCDVRPVVVIEDSDRVVSLYLPAGTPTMMPRPTRPGASKPWAPGEWQLVPASWDRWHTLLLHVPGEWRSTWAMWSPDWEFLGWYVNIEEPLRRTRWGFDNRDLQLDILVSTGGEWRWKDLEDFERACDTGLISGSKAALAQESASAAIGAIEPGHWPFVGDISAWRPAGFERPRMPEGDDLEAVLSWPADLRWDRPAQDR